MKVLLVVILSVCMLQTVFAVPGTYGNYPNHETYGNYPNQKPSNQNEQSPTNACTAQEYSDYREAVRNYYEGRIMCLKSLQLRCDERKCLPELDGSRETLDEGIEIFKTTPTKLTHRYPWGY